MAHFIKTNRKGRRWPLFKNRSDQKSIFCHNLAQMSLLLLLRLIVFNAVKWLALNGSIKHCCQ